ncbi:MAG: hypothetical protein ACI9OJ_003567 [Myxococcota bacterium]|jgi:hypothetical protein
MKHRGLSQSQSVSASASISLTRVVRHVGSYSFMIAHCADMVAPGAPGVTIQDGGGEFINAAEAQAGATVTMTLPDNALQGDTLSLSIDGPNTSPATVEQTLEAIDLQNQKVEIVVAMDFTPLNEKLQITATLSDLGGNIGSEGLDDVVVDSNPPPTPTVTVDTGDDDKLDEQDFSGTDGPPGSVLLLLALGLLLLLRRPRLIHSSAGVRRRPPSV